MAVVAAYHGRALFADGRLPDMSGYERNLTLDPGVTIAAGGGLSCVTGGGSATYVSGDYIGVGASVSCFAKVTSLSNTVARRAIVTLTRGTSEVVRFLLSNASGNVEVEYGNHLSLQHFATTTSIRDGLEHSVGFAIDVLSGTRTWNIWVDGVIVASGTPTADLSSAGGTFTYGKGDSLSNPPAIANAVVKDLRWFNDPTYTSEAYLFDTAVTNLVVAAYNFDAGSGTLVADQTLRHNDLTLGANGQWVTGVDGSAISPIAAGNPAASGTGLALYDGTFDRISVLGWVKAKGVGASAAPFFHATDASGNPKLQIFKGSAGGILFKAFGDGATWPFLDGNYRFGADGVLSTTEWRFVHINLNPTGYLIQVWGPTGTVIDDTQNNTFGTPPTNLPILTGLSRLYIGGAPGSGGEVEWDDLRVIRNYLNPLAVTNLRTSHVTQEPEGVIPVVKAQSVGWNVRAAVAKTLGVSFNVAQRVSKAAPTSWSVLAKVAKAQAVAFAVMARVIATTRTTWNTQRDGGNPVDFTKWSDADLELLYLASTQGAVGPSLADARLQVYGADDRAYFAARSGLPVDTGSLSDHRLAYYRAQTGTTNLSLPDTARLFWGSSLLP